MLCPKCNGELKVTSTSDEQIYIEVRLTCQENPEHRFEAFIDQEDIIEQDT